MDMLDREFGSNLMAEYPASITDNKCHIVWVALSHQIEYLVLLERTHFRPNIIIYVLRRWKVLSFSKKNLML